MKSAAAHSPRPAGESRGEIRSDTIPYLFHELGTTRATGILTVSDGEIRKTVRFRDGHVVFASSNQRDDRLNQTLLREEVLPLKDILKALEVALATKDRLGEVMVSRKMVPAETIARWVAVQMRAIVGSIFQWTQGHLTFEPRPLENESITLDAPADAMVLEGVRGIVSWSRVYEHVGGIHAEYRTTATAQTIVAALPLLPAEKVLLESCDAQPMSLEEICDASELSDYAICKSVWALVVIGALMKS